MPIITGQTAQASDFIDTSSGAGDQGKVPKLNSIGKIDNSCLPVKFGGNGSDGALSISSGTTTINLGGSRVVIKNYTSISITGTGVLAFSNPHANGTILILKSQGNVTLTSSSAPMIDASGIGSAVGNNAIFGTFFMNTCGAGGSGALYSTPAPGAAGGAMTLSPSSAQLSQQLLKYPYLFVGSAGGPGGSAGGGPHSGGNGAPGGGCLIMECGGAWNFTTANGISVAGLNGGNGVGQGSPNSGSGSGGGGGGGGCFIAFYNSLIANTGTVNSAGGNGGSGQFGGSGNYESSGGGGGAGLYPGGSSGTQNGGGAQGGQNGGAGFSLIAQNTEYI